VWVYYVSVGMGLPPVKKPEAQKQPPLPGATSSTVPSGGASADAKQLKLGSLLPSTGDRLSWPPMVQRFQHLVEEQWNQCSASMALINWDYGQKRMVVAKPIAAAGTEAMNQFGPRSG
jgi:hypothetical protein